MFYFSDFCEFRTCYLAIFILICTMYDRITELRPRANEPACSDFVNSYKTSAAAAAAALMDMSSTDADLADSRCNTLYTVNHADRCWIGVG